MSIFAFVKPREGYVVVDPDNHRRRLPADGARVDISSAFWVKAIRDGDVAIVPDDVPEIEIGVEHGH